MFYRVGAAGEGTRAHAYLRAATCLAIVETAGARHAIVAGASQST